MNARISRSLRTALAAVATVALAAGCSDGKAPDRKNQNQRHFPPSVAKSDALSHTNVAPATAPVIAPVIKSAVVAPTPPTTATPVVPEVLGFDGHLATGKRLYDAGDYREALSHIEQAAVIKPKSAVARAHLARVLLALGERHDARDYAEQAIELASDSSFAWNVLGRIELADKDLDAAETSFRRASEAEPDGSFAWNNLGYSLMAKGDYEGAAEALENATAGTSPTSYMWNNLGMAYEHLDRIREARAAYRQALALGSPKAEANMTRLEGVRSLIKRDADDEGDRPDSDGEIN